MSWKKLITDITREKLYKFNLSRNIFCLFRYLTNEKKRYIKFMMLKLQEWNALLYFPHIRLTICRSCKSRISKKREFSARIVLVVKVAIAHHEVEQQHFHERYHRHVEPKVRAKRVITAHVLIASSSCSLSAVWIQRWCHAIVRQIICVMSH